MFTGRHHVGTQGSRFIAAVAGFFLVAGCAVETPADGDSAPVRSSGTLWSAGHETGDISEWMADQSGAVFNTGSGSVVWTDQVARSGVGALELSVRGADSSPQAARIFRWAENPVEATYGAWYYFPEHVQAGRWWNIFQFKSRVGDTSEPTWIVNVGNRSDGSMFLYLYDAITRTSYTDVIDPPRPALPVGRWTNLEVFVRRADDRTGRIALWSDGRLLFDVDSVQTAFADNIQWSVNNYSDDLDPENVTIFVDDAVIIEGRPDGLE
jgi:hypothetical protein